MKFFERLAQRILKLLKLELVRLSHHLLIVRRGSNHFQRAGELERFMCQRDLGHLLRQFNVNCVLDVGANTGQYARSLRRLGYTGHIISFEPVGELYEKLLSLSAHDPKWSVHRFALGSKDATGVINITHAKVFSSLLKPNAASREHFGNGGEVRQTEEIEVKRLENVLDELIEHVPDPRIFLKMDTQGYDLEVFAGLGKQVERLVGLQSEVSLIPIYEGMPRMMDAIARYESKGFEIAGFAPVSKDQATSRVIEYDCTMVRAALAA
jgi:FkbM family methyltransferase